MLWCSFSQAGWPTSFGTLPHSSKSDMCVFRVLLVHLILSTSSKIWKWCGCSEGFFLSRVSGEERPLSRIPLERREMPGERTPCEYLSVYLYVVRIVWARLRLKTSPKPRKVMWVGVQNDVDPPNSEHFPKSLKPECVFRRASSP